MKTLRDLFKDYRFCFSFVVLVIILILAFLSFFSPYDPTLWNVVPKDLQPSAKYLLGTDSNGQDIFWQATFAVRNSLIISLIAALVSRVIAILVGMVAGYKGGSTDRVLMFLGDSLLVIPLFLIIVMLAMLVREYHESGDSRIAAIDLRLGMGRAPDPLGDLELARTRVHPDCHPFWYRDSQTGIERIHALCHAADLLDLDQ